MTAETAELLRHYFIQHSSLQLPGIGSFTLDRIPAAYDHAAGVLRSPRYAVHYDANHDIPSRSLFSYVSRKQNITEWEAIGIVNNFSLGVKELLKKGQRFEWAGMGILETEDSGQLIFRGEDQFTSFGRDFTISADGLLREGTGNSAGSYAGQEDATIEARASWWISAAIIAATALILIFISLVRNDYRFTTGRETRTDIDLAPAQYDYKKTD